MIINSCLSCGKSKPHRPSYRSKTKYCDNACQQEYAYNIAIGKWIEENRPITKCTARKYLSRQQSGCYICNIVEWNGKAIGLDIDHIDGNAYHNRPENLRLICPNCHSQTDFYKNKNRGRGRKLGPKEGWLLY